MTSSPRAAALLDLRDKRGRSLRALCVLGAVVSVVSGCSGELPEGKIRSADGHLTVCAPTTTLPVVALGWILDFDEGGDIEIDKVRPVDPRYVTVAEAMVMPVSENDRLGVVEYPPTESYPEEWAQAVPAEGAIIRPGEHRDLVVRVEPTRESGGELGDLEIFYNQDGKKYRTLVGLTLEMRPAGC